MSFESQLEMRFAPVPFIPRRTKKRGDGAGAVSVGRATPRAPQPGSEPPNRAHGVTRPTRPSGSRMRFPVVALILLAAFAHAQDSQFLFDPNGNLFVQTAATT